MIKIGVQALHKGVVGSPIHIKRQGSKKAYEFFKSKRTLVLDEFWRTRTLEEFEEIIESWELPNVSNNRYKQIDLEEFFKKVEEEDEPEEDLEELKKISDETPGEPLKGEDISKMETTNVQMDLRNEVNEWAPYEPPKKESKPMELIDLLKLLKYAGNEFKVEGVNNVIILPKEKKVVLVKG